MLQLGSWIETARHGRQIVFITGEPGIGKTALVETFVRGAFTDDTILVAQGHCSEHYGAGEAYLPILDALEKLCRLSSTTRIAQLLRQYAPSWLVDLPTITDPAERFDLQKRRIGNTQERTLREMAGFLEALAREQTVVLVLEDLHWADPLTVSLISFLARRREEARLMIVATYRVGETVHRKHPIELARQKLQLRTHTNHLRLRRLDRIAVNDYLQARFTTAVVPENLSAMVYRRSEGNPLFMVSAADAVIKQNIFPLHKETPSNKI